MNYLQSLQYLQELEQFGIKLGLENITRLLERLGHPEKNYPSVIVGGTNGKGSVSVMLSAILEDAGYRVGTYLSPHLVRPEERILINGREISEESFSSGLSRIRRAIGGQGGQSRHPTYFEVLTALALQYFNGKQVDVAVLEVGLGGRFDATNAVPAVLSVITNVSLDHQIYLGQKISQIAREKGGIIKRNGGLVSGSKSRGVNGILSGMCGEKKSAFYTVKAMVQTYIEQKDNHISLTLTAKGMELRNLRLALPGIHQGENAATAFLSAMVLQERGFRLPAEAFRSGLERARLGGRLEVVNRDPTVIIDGAHNRRAALKLAGYIKRLEAKRKYLVFAVMKDKDASGISKILFPLCGKIFLFPLVSGDDRAMTPDDIRRLGIAYNRRIEKFPSLEACFEYLLNHLGRGDTVVCAGSIYLAGAVRRFFVSRREA